MLHQGQAQKLILPVIYMVYKKKIKRNVINLPYNKMLRKFFCKEKYFHIKMSIVMWKEYVFIFLQPRVYLGHYM